VIEARMHLPTPPGERRWRHLMALAEVLSEANAEWFGAQMDHAQSQRDRGFQVEDPPCCISCAVPDIVYRPPPTGDKQFCQNWWSAPAVLNRGRANCLDASAFDVGAARAKGKEAYVLLEPVGEPRIAGDVYSTLDWHAVAMIDGQRVDSSATLSKANGKGCSCG
jgi:hypothetical protein